VYHTEEKLLFFTKCSFAHHTVKIFIEQPSKYGQTLHHNLNQNRNGD